MGFAANWQLAAGNLASKRTKANSAPLTLSLSKGS
jgi:hypothetical protein